MAIFRNVHLSFWTDPKVDEEFTPEDKYFYLYILTNPHTNLVGCYEIGIKQMSRETGYATETIERLINRLEEVHKVVRFCKSTKELLVENWSKYNWTSSPKLFPVLVKECESIKCKAFRDEIREKIYGIDRLSENERYGIDRVSTGERYPMDTTDTDISINNINTDRDIDIDTSTKIKDIVNYLNDKCGTRYKHSSNKTRTLIKTRLNDGFTVEDFKAVIDKKYSQWRNDYKMSKYLRPETLFGTKFESYLNEKTVQKKSTAETVMGWLSP